MPVIGNPPEDDDPNNAEQNEPLEDQQELTDEEQVGLEPAAEEQDDE